jgi:hypothetical protein
LQALEQTQTLAPSGVEVITVCDREADIYEMFAFAEKQQASLLVRASSNRLLIDDEVRKLWPKVEKQPVVGQLSVQIAGNDKRKARQATVSVRFTSVTLKPPWRPNGLKLPTATLNAILVREENPPADIDEPIEWLLLTNTPVTSFDEAYQVSSGTALAGKSRSFTRSSSQAAGWKNAVCRRLTVSSPLSP